MTLRGRRVVAWRQAQERESGSEGMPIQSGGWLDRNGMAVVGLLVGLTLYLVGSFAIDQEAMRDLGAATLGASGGLKLDGVWSRKKWLA